MMLEENAVVVKAEGNQIWLETQSRSACNHCSSTQCSTSVLAKLFNVRRNQMVLENHLKVNCGDKVTIAVPDQVLVKAALWIYFVPLLIMLNVVIFANHLGASEIIQCLGGIVGLLVGFFVVKHLTNKSDRQFKPILLPQSNRIQTVILNKRI